MIDLRALSALLFVFSACSSSAESPPSPTTVPGSPDAGSTATADGGGLDASSGPTYPTGPYGMDVGDTISPLDFQGWSTKGYDVAKPTTVQLDQFYAPSGDATHRLLVINVCSVWCLPCKNALASFATKAPEYAAKGATFLSLLYENGENKPVSLAEAATYAGDVGAGTALVIDPTYQLSNAVRPGEVPAYVVINVRDMKVLGTLKDVPEGPWAFVDQKLAEIQ